MTKRRSVTLKYGYVRPNRTNDQGMNKTEAAYARRLELLKRAGEIMDYRFEALTFTLAHNVPGKMNGTRYTPDFLVVTEERFEIHEVKGHWEEDARVKVKVAAEMYPWVKFIAVKKKRNGWEYEEFN